MAENVQCPVCTLYLHAGMNLSDHLETHPKEQVIRALVQMTISGLGVGSSSALASVLAVGDKSVVDDTKKFTTSKLELDEKHLPNDKINDLIIGGTGSSCSVTSISNSASNCSLSNQSATSSQSSNNTINFNTTSNIEHRNSASEQDRTTTSSPATPIKTTFKSELQNATSNFNDVKVVNENLNDGFPKQGFRLSSAVNASQAYHAGSAIELPNLSNTNTNFTVFGNQRYEQQQQNRGGVSNKTQLHTPPNMPPPPPPPSSTQPAPTQQNQHSLQHQEISRAPLTSLPTQQSITLSSTGGSFHTQQQQQLPPPPPPPHHSSSHLGNVLNNHRQPHMYPVQHQQPPNSHHPQSLKVIYTPALPPPPPLQLFTYQPPIHLQHHQKPPPAYGTAISQIRSQHNQSKHQVTGSLATQHQHPTLQTHALQQQQQHQQQQQQQQQQHILQQQQTLHHNLRINVPPPPLPIPIKHLLSTKANELAAPLAPPPSATTTTSSTSASLAITTTRLSPQQPQHLPKKSFPDLSQQTQHTDSNDRHQTQNLNYHGLNSNEMSNKTTKGSTATTQNLNANAAPSYPQVSISPSIASASMAAVAASTLGRHTNSPFAALLAAAAGAPSPSGASSVLRYAESPVAHYLERENGDFIVQETPKHIVECVEKDNGEFSVIERIYQSPPSVLHIHDDDDDDDDGEEEEIDEDNSNRDTDNGSDDEMKHEPKEPETLHKDELATSVASSSNKMAIETNKSTRNLSKHSEDNVTSDNEIVDFVSISSDSEDEEFISHERKDLKNIIEKCKKDETSPMTSTSIMSLSSSSSTTLTNCDHLSAVTTPTPTLHSPASTTAAISQNHQMASSSTSSGSRKKSSKNTVTVLSDVQLNLNEYLDLVGNIIASSKVAAQRRTIATIPLVKIEKEEPMDDYAMTTTMVTSDVAVTTATPTFEPPTPLKANKHETDEIDTDIPSSSSKHKNNHNLSLINELQPQQQQQKHKEEEQEDKKPQVLENMQDNCNGQRENFSAVSNSTLASTSSLVNMNSSHVTSVIRMATTSQSSQQQLLQQLNKTETSTEAEDLSQPQRKTETIPNSKAINSTNKPLARKGPKKLVIKPKSSRTEISLSTSINNSTSNNTQNTTTNHCARDQREQQPTTSAKAIQEYAKQNRIEEIFNNSDHIQVKNEPITSITYENHHYQQTAGFSILEQHLSSKDPPPLLECKEEKPCITETSLPASLIEMKIENNVNDDARVLYDFANSKKKSSNSTTSNVISTFPSSTSLFSNNLTTMEHSTNFSSEAGNNKKSKSLNQDLDTSSYSSQSAMDATLPSQEHTENSATNTSTTAADHPHHHNPQTQVFTDFPFSYLYNGSNIEEQVDIKNHHQFTAFYQNVNTTTNNNNNSMLMDDSSSSKHYADYQPHQQQQQHQQPGTSQTHHQWFNSNNNNQNNYQTPDANNAARSISSNHSASNLNSSISIDGNGALDGSVEVGKYLDLDTCKREQNIDMIVGGDGDRVTVPPPPPPSSSTSCSFTGTTDNSMAGICSTAATLNIRTDEKMPAKGEISEQESNCDIDNSWSQPMYGDISARFFKTTFPGIFPQDNGWSHDDYFTVQDLSASTTAQATNANNRLKSFEDRLPLDGNGTGNTSNNGGLPIFSQNSNDNCNIDVMPSTSSKIRKRRKRNSQDGKTTQASVKRMQPTATITSQQMMMQHQNEIPGVDFNFQHQQEQTQQQQQLQRQHLQQLSTSAEFLAGPSNAGSTAASSSFMMQQQPLQQQQQQQQQPTQQKQRTKVYECGICNAKYSKLKERNAHMIDIHNYIRQNRRLVCPTTGLATPLTNADMQDVALPTTSAASSMLMPPLQNADCLGDYKQGIVKIEHDNIQRDLGGMDPPISANLSAKTEVMEDDKKILALIPMTGGNSSSNVDYVDTKPPTNSLPLALTTPTSKLTTLYRMLVSFNMTTLKESHSLSEIDESLIKSSIFFCYICRENFNSVKMYDAHLTEHPAECFTCGKKFQRWKNFSLHLKRHLGWKEFGCTVCDKKFVVRSALVEHTRMHSGLSPLKCKVCGKHFKRYSNLTQHRKRHTKQTIRRKEYVCYCGEVLPSKARFLWHKETHDSKPKCCPHCCDRFVHVNSLRRHIRLAHSDKFNYNEPMECPICKQIFAKASMKAHMATHSTETQYDCAICRKSFSTKWNLKIHSWVHANRTSKPFKCEHCPKAFVREVDFKNHMNSHKQIKPYTCEVCGCKFIRKYNYMRHRREHHGNKKYTCDLCKKSFHRHYYLIEHRRIHTGERPFQCTICGKSSTTKTNHNKHLKIHHSRDPFTVEV